MRPWWASAVLAVGCAHGDGATDTDVDTTADTDPLDTDAADTDANGPFDAGVALGNDAIDPEFFADLKMVIWQDPNTSKAWAATVVPESGQWLPGDGRGLKLGNAASMSGSATAPPTYNGPEWGDSGDSIFFTMADADGFNQVARFARGSGTASLLTGGDQIHRNGVIPQLHPAGDRAAMLFFRGELADLDFAWRWLDDTVDHSFTGATSADPTPRWMPGEDAIGVLVADDAGFAQVARYDIHTEQTTMLTTDEGYKSDPFISDDPAGGRLLTVDVSETVPPQINDLVPTRIAVYREGVDGWTRQVTFGVEDTLGGGPYAHTSLEPFVYEGQVWVSFVAVPGVSRSTPSQVYVASIDGSQIIQVTHGTAARGDPEVLVLDGHALLYYTEHRAGVSARVHVVRDFMP
jgi:hypothetical protein